MERHSEDRDSSQLYDVVEKILEPLVALFVDQALTSSEFTTLIENQFVHEARTYYGIRGRPASVSKIAARTGLTRKKVRAYIDETVVPRENPIKSVLFEWSNCKPWLTSTKRPKALPKTGTISFTSLCQSVVGAASPSTVLRMLIESKNVRKLGSGRYRLDSDVFMGDSEVTPDASDYYTNAARSINWLVAERLFARFSDRKFPVTKGNLRKEHAPGLQNATLAVLAGALKEMPFDTEREERFGRALSTIIEEMQPLR